MRVSEANQVPKFGIRFVGDSVFEPPMPVRPENPFSAPLDFAEIAPKAPADLRNLDRQRFLVSEIDDVQLFITSAELNEEVIKDLRGGTLLRIEDGTVTRVDKY